MHHATWTDVPTLQTQVGADRMHKNNISFNICSIWIFIFGQMFTVFVTLCYALLALSINISQHSTKYVHSFALDVSNRLFHWAFLRSINFRERYQIIFHKRYLAVFSHNKLLMLVVQETSNVKWTVILRNSFVHNRNGVLIYSMSEAAYVFIGIWDRTFWQVTLLNRVVEINASVF